MSEDIEETSNQILEISNRITAMDTKLLIQLEELEECADSMDVLRWVIG